ncbi:hypothetical protein VV02_25255 [Luteipulveratus mongoliensis]|uniref:Peptidase C60 sortase A and B n=2 Tax=Luteipulveratus mongoliensis TaxID=571913 RepID=A0A0K1JP81_9MICO|nr:hypothetical protein VV02_25255 [Luteipulveratus mongoliensis]
MVSAAAAVLALSGAGLVAYGLSQQDTATPPSPGTSGHHHGAAPPPASTTTRAAGRAGAAYVLPVGQQMARSQPTRVRIPSLGVSSDMIKLGLQPNKRMAVPQNGSQSGWFDQSRTPGELGPAIVAAHVTWHGKRGVFFNLGAMKEGQKVEVDRADGSTAIFQVEDIGQYPKAKFPTDKVYGSVDHAALRLITCGGVYDGDAGHHLDNVVVFAKLVGTKKA